MQHTSNVRHPGKAAGMTLAEARRAGYREGAGASYCAGYVSRKPCPETEIPVYIAGGYQSGKLYYLDSCRESSQYCYRVYLKKA